MVGKEKIFFKIFEKAPLTPMAFREMGSNIPNNGHVDHLLRIFKTP
jgi:hypothetical protein